MVAMAALRDLLAHVGLADVRSVLQSGNLVFRSRATAGARLEQRLESEATKRLSLQADFVVRTAAEWKAIVARTPFRGEAARDPARVAVMFLKSAPGAAQVRALQSVVDGPEIVRVDGRHAYIVYPDGIGRSRLSGALIEKTLGTRGTVRNWNTVLKLDAFAEP
jgi:uncharacterized protein (DUF1697 family)